MTYYAYYFPLHHWNELMLNSRMDNIVFNTIYYQIKSVYWKQD